MDGATELDFFVQGGDVVEGNDSAEGHNESTARIVMQTASNTNHDEETIRQPPGMGIDDGIGHDQPETEVSPAGDSDHQAIETKARTSKVISSHITKWLLMSITVVSVVLTGVVLWPSIAAQKDAHSALQLAEWTALKEYYEFCSHNVSEQISPPLE
jgi:hypothetical protein